MLEHKPKQVCAAGCTFQGLSNFGVLATTDSPVATTVNVQHASFAHIFTAPPRADLSAGSAGIDDVTAAATAAGGALLGLQSAAFADTAGACNVLARDPASRVLFTAADSLAAACVDDRGRGAVELVAELGPEFLAPADPRFAALLQVRHRHCCRYYPCCCW